MDFWDVIASLEAISLLSILILERDCFVTPTRNCQRLFFAMTLSFTNTHLQSKKIQSLKGPSLQASKQSPCCHPYIRTRLLRHTDPQLPALVPRNDAIFYKYTSSIKKNSTGVFLNLEMANTSY